MKTKNSIGRASSDAAFIGQAPPWPSRRGRRNGRSLRTVVTVLAAVSTAAAASARPGFPDGDSTHQLRRSVASADHFGVGDTRRRSWLRHTALFSIWSASSLMAPSIMDEFGHSVTPSIAPTAVGQPRSFQVNTPIGQRPTATFLHHSQCFSGAFTRNRCCTKINGRTDSVMAQIGGINSDRRHAHFFRNRFFVFDNGFGFGLDDGFFPWDYLPYYAGDYYAFRLLH